LVEGTIACESCCQKVRKVTLPFFLTFKPVRVEGAFSVHECIVVFLDSMREKCEKNGMQNLDTENRLLVFEISLVENRARRQMMT